MKFGQRDLIILNVEPEQSDSAASIPGDRDYLLLLPAYTVAEKEISFETASSLIGPGCRELCCVGPLAADLEDQLDSALEQSDRLDIVTTSFHHAKEALEYVLFSAGGARPSLCIVAAVGGNADLVRSMVLLAARA